MSDQFEVTSFLGAAIAVLTGLFGFTHVRVKQVRDELRADIDAMKEEMTQQTGQHRQAQQQLWSELRLMEIRANDHRSKVQERIGHLPTREEMKQDLGAMETRLEALVTRARN